MLDWRTVGFGDVVRNVDETVRDPLTCDLERIVGLEHIDPESLRIKRWGLIADGTSFARKFVAGGIGALYQLGERGDTRAGAELTFWRTTISPES